MCVWMMKRLIASALLALLLDFRLLDRPLRETVPHPQWSLSLAEVSPDSTLRMAYF